MRLATGIFLLVVPFLCFAQEELNDDRKILKRPDVNAAMSEPVYNRLSRIHDQMGEDQLSGKAHAVAPEPARQLEPLTRDRRPEALALGRLRQPPPGLRRRKRAPSAPRHEP